MKAILIFVLTLLLFACDKPNQKETFYILYYGDHTFSFPDLVIKNDSSAYVDSIMPIGKPDEYVISQNEFSAIKSKIQKHAPFADTNGFQTGIRVIHYADKELKESYLFSPKEVNQLIEILETDLTGKNKKETTEWIKGVCQLKEIDL